MSSDLGLPAGWKPVERPPALFRRFEFGSYGQTRDFLDRLAQLSERTGLYPDLGFGKAHVNVTIHGAGGNLPGATEIDFASIAAGLAEPPAS